MGAKEIAYNVFWDWKAVPGTLPPEAVRGRLLSMGFEFDETIEAYVMVRKMSSHTFRGDCHSIGIKTVAIEGTQETEEVES